MKLSSKGDAYFSTEKEETDKIDKEKLKDNKICDELSQVPFENIINKDDRI